MGAVSGAALEAGGKVTGITPYAINQAGGEREKARTGVEVELGQEGREAVSLFTTPIPARLLIVLIGLGRNGEEREAIHVAL
jgi:predicted Rossmann-fold nucleotide-binding protein